MCSTGCCSPRRKSDGIVVVASGEYHLGDGCLATTRSLKLHFRIIFLHLCRLSISFLVWLWLLEYSLIKTNAVTTCSIDWWQSSSLWYEIWQYSQKAEGTAWSSHNHYTVWFPSRGATAGRAHTTAMHWWPNPHGSTTPHLYSDADIWYVKLSHFSRQITFFGMFIRP